MEPFLYTFSLALWRAVGYWLINDYENSTCAFRTNHYRNLDMRPIGTEYTEYDYYCHMWDEYYGRAKSYL